MKKTLLLLLTLTILSCSQKELVSVEVKRSRASTVALFDGKYSVHFMNRPDLLVDFPISGEEIRRVKNAYIKQDIAVFGEDLLINPGEPIIMPAQHKEYILQFSDGTQQSFTIKFDYRTNPLDKEKYRQLKIFLETIDNIIESKQEIKNAERSDVWHI